MSSSGQYNIVNDDINLGTLPSDVIRRIIGVGPESIDAMRYISPRWNSLALHYLNDYKRLPVIDYLKCRSKNLTFLKIPKGNAGKITVQDYNNFEKNENAEWTFHLLVPGGFNNFFGVTCWSRYRCNHFNSECLAHYPSSFVERTFCAANVHNLAVTTFEIYSHLTKDEGEASLITKLANLIGRCSRIAIFDIQNRSDDIEVIRDGLGNVIVDHFMASVPKRLFHKQSTFYIDFIKCHSVQHFSLNFNRFNWNSDQTVVKNLFKELSSVVSLQRITFTFLEMFLRRSFGETLWEARKSEITEAENFDATVLVVNRSSARYEFHVTFSASRIQQH